MDGFEKRRNDKKKAIMQTALELFDHYGFDKVTMTEIAEKAHVSKVSIYNFFESKDNLRRIIIMNMLDESIAKIKELIEKEGDFFAKIEQYIQIRTWYYGQYSLRFFFGAVESDPELRNYFDHYNTANKELFIKFITAGKRSAVFAQDVSDTAIGIYLDMIQSYFLHNKEIRNQLEHNPELVRQLNVLFLDGLIQQKSRK